MRTTIAMLACLTLFGCASTGIALKEAFGYAKREQLVDRVEDARDGQEQAKKQFASALDEFLALTRSDTTDLEAAYERLKRQLERSEQRADAVHSRIKDVERVAEALFREWEGELAQYHSDDLRAASAAQLERTRTRYDELLGAMKSAEAKMQPVLDAFNDQVLFLKHNLNARAIASLDRQVASLETEITALIAEMDASIAEADSFIAEMASE
ncbi:MAG: DUF2959 domain-containing protein [Planctomycetota bacterium]|nr:MAG: DUF2959 domain-containing protein [Planctomycetota bacterium]